MIAFVILHYNNLKDTIECVDSIEENVSSAKIVIVSNSFDNDKLKILEKRVDKIIYNNQNLGFAKANNIGCRYAREIFNPDFIAVINNDTLILDSNFSKMIENDYKKYNFDCLGPFIKTDGGDSVNPFCTYKTVDEVKKAIKNAKMWCFIYKVSLFRCLYHFYRKVKYHNRKPTSLKNGNIFCIDVSLHGCFLVFSKKYFSKYRDVFFNGTFLYHEEEFLEYRRSSDNLLFIYDPDLKIFHKEGASLAQTSLSNHKKQIFRYGEIIKSLELLLDVIINNKRI